MKYAGVKQGKKCKKGMGDFVGGGNIFEEEGLYPHPDPPRHWPHWWPKLDDTY